MCTGLRGKPYAVRGPASEAYVLYGGAEMRYCPLTAPPRPLIQNVPPRAPVLQEL
jgi:hypothetical protein